MWRAEDPDMKRMAGLAAILMAMIGFTAPSFAQSKGAVEHITVHGKSLEGNLK
jgi:hypothetical protein